MEAVGEARWTVQKQNCCADAQWPSSCRMFSLLFLSWLLICISCVLKLVCNLSFVAVVVVVVVLGVVRLVPVHSVFIVLLLPNVFLVRIFHVYRGLGLSCVS